MGWIIGTVILGIVAVVCWIIGNSLEKEYNNEASDSYHDNPTKNVSRGLRIAAWTVAIFGVGGLTVASSIQIIDAGHVGVVKTFGAITGQIDDGPSLVAPWSDVTSVSTKAERKEFDKLMAFSKETQDVFVDATMNLAVAPDEIQCLYRTIGSDWYDKLIPPRVLQTLKDETVKYSTVAVAPAREEIRIAVKDRLRAQLKDFTVREGACAVSIDVQDFLIRNIDFRPEFKAAIERKQIATQDAQTAKNKVAQATEEANQAVATADGERQVKIKNAQGEAAATLLNATAQAKANRLIAKSVTPELISFQYVSKLAAGVQWIVTADGKIAVPPGVLTPAGKK
ncbi:MAG: prohibitin family protein [bacterium]|nr:prohibitin family protein [bacterium]